MTTTGPAAGDARSSGARVGSAPASWIPAAIVGLIAVRLFVLVLVLASPPADPWVARAETIATSPATPYRDFPLSLMPAEAFAIELLGGAGDDASARRVAIVAFVADLAIAAAVARGWGRRASALSLALGLPLLGVAYLRLELVAVAAAAWAAVAFRGRRDGRAAVLLGLAAWWKLWPIVLAPAAWAARRGAAVIPATVVVAIGGVAWFLWGGRDGPLQVLTSRGAVGWAVDGTVGSVVRLVTGGPAVLEAGVLRVGTIPFLARAALLVVLVLVLIAVWRDAARDPGRDPAGATAIAAIAALLALAPSPPILAAAWTVPFAAVALLGDREERRVGVLAAAAIALSGLLALRETADDDAVLAAVALARNLLWIAAVASWFSRPLPTAARDRP